MTPLLKDSDFSDSAGGMTQKSNGQKKWAGSVWKNGPLVRPENAWRKVKILEFTFLPRWLILSYKFVLILS